MLHQGTTQSRLKCSSSVSITRILSCHQKFLQFCLTVDLSKSCSRSLLSNMVDVLTHCTCQVRLWQNIQEIQRPHWILRIYIWCHDQRGSQRRWRCWCEEVWRWRCWCEEVWRWRCWCEEVWRWRCWCEEVWRWRCWCEEVWMWRCGGGGVDGWVDLASLSSMQEFVWSNCSAIFCPALPWIRCCRVQTCCIPLTWLSRPEVIKSLDVIQGSAETSGIKGVCVTTGSVVGGGQNYKHLIKQSCNPSWPRSRATALQDELWSGVRVMTESWRAGQASWCF